MAQDTDPHRDLDADADTQRRAVARRWARNALAEARTRFDPAARDELRTRLGRPPTAQPR